jgi:hypothetical protein
MNTNKKMAINPWRDVMVKPSDNKDIKEAPKVETYSCCKD